MEYLPLLIVVVTLIVPIFLPLVYWYVLKNRTSRIYSVCRNMRRVWAVLVVGLIMFKAYQLPSRVNYNAYEVIGEFIAQFVIAYLLWKVWKEPDSPTEEVTNTDN